MLGIILGFYWLSYVVALVWNVLVEENLLGLVFVRVLINGHELDYVSLIKSSVKGERERERRQKERMK